MAKTVRDIDEEKIRDTKEDIDTLLVFVRTLHHRYIAHLTLMWCR